MDGADWQQQEECLEREFDQKKPSSKTRTYKEISNVQIYKSISKVMRDMCKTGVHKGQFNNFDKYKFRGIDDIYNAISPVLCRHNIVVMPEVVTRNSLERPSKEGKTMIYTTLECKFHLICTIDGSSHTVKVVGEAMDRSDKSTNKAMSAAYKYAMIMTFCIPVEGQDIDPDNESPEIVSKQSEEEDEVVSKLYESISNAVDNNETEALKKINTYSSQVKQRVWSLLSEEQKAKAKQMLQPGDKQA